jgi:hypothetical protein
VIRGVAAYRQAQTLSWTPVLGGIVVLVTSLVVRWLLLRVLARASTRTANTLPPTC